MGVKHSAVRGSEALSRNHSYTVSEIRLTYPFHRSRFQVPGSRLGLGIVKNQELNHLAARGGLPPDTHADVRKKFWKQQNLWTKNRLV